MLMQKGTVLQLPSHMDGMLWQCDTCELSFVKKKFIDDHLRFYCHQRESFHMHIPADWQSKFIDPPQEETYFEESFLQDQTGVIDNESLCMEQSSTDNGYSDGEVLVKMENETTDENETYSDSSNSDDDYDEEDVEEEIEGDEHKVTDTINRRNAILRALINDEEDLTDRPPSFFRPSDEDKEWIKKVWRIFINDKTKKNTKLGEEVHPDVVKALQSGGDIPKLYQRQVARTAENYAYGLTFVAEMYQQEARKSRNNPNYELQYSDFLNFADNERHIYLCDPFDYLKNKWASGTLGQKKHFISAHAHLRRLVWNECLSAEGQTKFIQSYRGEKYAQKMGIEAQATYMKLLERLGDLDRANQPSQWINDKIGARKAKDKNMQAQIWANNYGIGKSEDVQMDIKKFLNSEVTRHAQNILIKQGTPQKDGKVMPPLSKNEWALGTRIRVLTIQAQHSGRTEIVNMTVGEFWERIENKDALVYTVIVRRDWTKLSGYRNEPAFLALNAFDEALCIFYERCRKIQHPHLYPPACSDEQLFAQPFFVNGRGNPYIREKGGVDKDHMGPWTQLRGRKESPTTFRLALANFSLNTDEVTRLNIAFVNQHSKATMEYWYATLNEKSRAAIKALQNYREKCLGIDSEPTTEAGEKIANKPTKSAAIAQLIKWRAVVMGNVNREKKEDADKERTNIDKRGSNESRAALIELCLTEIQTGQPVSKEKYYLADFLLRRGKDVIKRKRIGESEIHQAILDVIDSARFFECPSSISLRNIMLRVARNKNVEIGESDSEREESISRLEYDCLFSWRGQLNNLASVGIGQRTARITWAMLQMQEATGSKFYSLGNPIIQISIDTILARKSELELDVANADGMIELSHQKSPGEVIRIHERRAQETAQMSPMEIRKCAQAILDKDSPMGIDSKSKEEEQEEEEETKKPRQSVVKRLFPY